MTLTLSATQVLTLGSPAIALVISGSFLCVWKFFDRRTYLALLACAFLFYATGAAMQILHWPSDVRLHAIVPAGIYLLSIACMTEGILRRYGQQAGNLLLSICVLTGLVVCYYSLVDPDVDARSCALHFGIGTVLCLAAWRIRCALRANLIDRTLFWVFTAFGLSFHARAILNLMVPTEQVPDVINNQTFWLILQLSLVVSGLILALLLFAASLADLITRLRDDRDLDGLTGLWNRRALDERLDTLIADAGQQPYALMLIDIDHFKSINDRYGHAVGDNVLRVVGQLIRDCAGPTALTGRVGGEEFAIVVPAELPEAHQLAQRFNRVLHETRIADVAADHLITASTGLTMLQVGDTVSLWMRRADKLLYQAKRDGRNRVVLQAAAA